MTPPESNNMFTGASYINSLDDGREVWYDGERVSNVATHPAFKNAVRTVAQLYDSLHDEKLRDLLTGVDQFGHRTHHFFKPSYNASELLAARDAAAVDLHPASCGGGAQATTCEALACCSGERGS